FCYAEGTVVGRLSDRTEVFVSREYERTVKKELNPISLDLKIFNLNINIFKKYRNYSEGCDIIEDVKVFSLKNDKSLPISLTTKYILDCTNEKAFYTDEELVRLASRAMSAKNALRLNSSDLLKITTNGEFTDSGYKMYSDLVFLSDVGEAVEFSAD
ncbi:MAG: sporulation protein YqfD, partial [Clostridia bacterium]|nr:sporulation protein YqfD [Clostridia bacterium]